MSASAIAATVCQPTPKKKSPKAGIATSSASARKVSTEKAFASQIALRSDGAMTSASKTPCSRSGTNARVRPSSAVKRIAIQSSPIAVSWSARFALAGIEKWKTVSAATTNTSIAGTVSFARSSISKSLRASAATSEKYLIGQPSVVL